MMSERLRAAFILFDRVIAPLVVFTAIYLGALLALASAIRPDTPLAHQTIAFFAAFLATTGAVLLLTRRAEWLVIRPRIVFRQSVAGIVVAAALILAADLLVQAFGDYSRAFAGGFSARELLWLLPVAAAHEELLFRGYVFQRLQELSVPFAISATAVVFAAMHMSNRGLTEIAMVNLFLGGLLLGLLRAQSGTIWLPFAFHWAWNAFSGSLLGYEVSGFEMVSVFRESDRGPALVTGGSFGIEASIFVTLVTTVAIVACAMQLRRSRKASAV